MGSNRITVRIPPELTARLRSRSRTDGITDSELIRQALEKYLGGESLHQTAYEIAEEAGIIGSVRNAPRDLSTSQRNFEGFGQHK